MTAWVVRAGSGGENEDLALDEGLVTIGWSETGDLSGLSKEQIKAVLEENHPNTSPKTIAVWTGEVWSFARSIALNDIAVLPLKRRAAVALGYVKSNYEYRADLADADAAHTRRVQWMRTDVPRISLDRPLLNTLGSSLTVFRAEKNGAAERLKAALEGAETLAPAEPNTAANESLQDAAPIEDFERAARDEIVALVQERFRGHALERLVEAILVADGFRVDRTRAGADGGIDLLAGRGTHGFDAPRICVQVKSGKSPEDVKTVRELQGALKNFGADHGIFVSWSGYTGAVYAEARRAFFQVRLWDADDLIDALLANYDKLDAEIRAELPLKRIWAPAIGDLRAG